MTALEAVSDRPAAAGQATRDEALARDVVEGLTRSPKRLAAKYLYDALGSHLFEAICELPWYPITRGERALLTRERDAILARLDDPATLVELGGGNGEKLAILTAGLAAQDRAATVHLIDISETALARAGRTLARHSSIAVRGHRGSYADGLRAAVAELQPGRSAMVLFLGSNIGNLAPSEADRFLADVGAALRPGDSLLLGTDLVKPEQELMLAYDDPLGVTAAFNRNLLVRLNRELDADFEIEQFAHRVVWNAQESRVESYLVSQAEQTVCLPGADHCIRFAEGETIWTESSHKYRPDDVVDMAARAGFAYGAQWIEPAAAFALTLFDAP
ncbi:MAG: L-histidine N(alpha)-methyltransferase [Acidobacteria bacterium]|nr:L-histidine N(alpha)-methyltransferase [Acidobacteriota bacterium]